jgi:pimeloyl-ACP methyl ester carboxylesterase
MNPWNPVPAARIASRPLLSRPEPRSNKAQCSGELRMTKVGQTLPIIPCWRHPEIKRLLYGVTGGQRVAEVVRMADGRRVSVELSGDPHGSPVFLLHGMPGSRLGPRPRGMVLHHMGVCLISFDRPGYGGSDRLQGRKVADAASDVAAIADAYGFDSFAVAGRSGGGPHALACAALLPTRTTRVAVLVGLAPQGANGLDWYDGMTNSNVIDFTAAEAGHDAIAGRLAATAERIRADPASLLMQLHDELPDLDRRLIADADIRRILVRSHYEGLRTSADGWIDDVIAVCTPWGFSLADITVPVLIWHGEADVFSPVNHARWLASQIMHTTVVLQRRAAHFAALAALPEALRWLVSPM